MSSSTPSPFRPSLNLRHLTFAIALLAVALPSASANDHDPDARDRLVDLKERSWRFSIGDDLRWAEPGFDDRRWSRIEVPGAWEDEGYDDYNGYAWYRCTFSFSDRTDQPTTLLLGQIDDVDEVYINGKRIGATGRFPPSYVSAWNRDRIYPLPSGTWQKNESNVIAVRVYDGGGRGGIMGHAIGVYGSDFPVPLIDLSGEWQFHSGDDPAWKGERADESGFSTIMVPGYWENSGFEDLDGFAWYRKTFRFNRRPDDDRLVMMMGKIDDTDEVYLNGTKIGSTGSLSNADRHSGVEYCDENRGYYFSASLLKEKNVLAVRVHDHGGLGGIYEGPIGIISQTEYIEYWETVRRDHRGIHSLKSFVRWWANH